MTVFREIKVLEMRSVVSGRPAGYCISVGCENLWVGTEEEVRTLLVSHANDPQGCEREAYSRWERVREGDEKLKLSRAGMVAAKKKQSGDVEMGGRPTNPPDPPTTSPGDTSSGVGFYTETL